MSTIIDIPKLPFKRSRLTSYEYDNKHNSKNDKKRYSSPFLSRDKDLDIPTSKYDLMSESERSNEIKYCKQGIHQFSLFTEQECQKLEEMIDEVVEKSKKKEYKKYTVDKTPLRSKYFFGEGYTYGGQMVKSGPNQERLYAKGDVDDIPEWINNLVIDPLLKSGQLNNLLPKNKKDFFNSAVINDYSEGGCIAPHIDPIHIFCRPIVTISLSSDSFLTFGSRFIYRPLRVSRPLIKLPLKRGVVTCLSGYAADNITHCVCPDDVTNRRTVLILRRVCDDAPRLPPYHEEEKNYHNKSELVKNIYDKYSKSKKFNAQNESESKLKHNSNKFCKDCFNDKIDKRERLCRNLLKTFNSKSPKISTKLGHKNDNELKNKNNSDVKKLRKSSRHDGLMHDSDTDTSSYIKSRFKARHRHGLLKNKLGYKSLQTKSKRVRAMSDDEDKTIVVKRKKKMLRVRVQSKDDG